MRKRKKENLKTRDQLGNSDVDERIILKFILNKLVYKGMDWIDLALNMCQWRALANTVINVRFHEGGEFFDKLGKYYFNKDSAP
jgi:hypothetical protein